MKVATIALNAKVVGPMTSARIRVHAICRMSDAQPEIPRARAAVVGASRRGALAVLSRVLTAETPRRGDFFLLLCVSASRLRLSASARLADARSSTGGAEAALRSGAFGGA